MNFLNHRIVLPCCCSVTEWCLTPGDPMDCSTPGSSVLHYLPEFAQTQVHWVRNAIQASHPLSSPSPPAHSLSQHQGLFKWVSSLHQVAKVLEFQLQHLYNYVTDKGDWNVHRWNNFLEVTKLLNSRTEKQSYVLTNYDRLPLIKRSILNTV